MLHIIEHPWNVDGTINICDENAQASFKVFEFETDQKQERQRGIVVI